MKKAGGDTRQAMPKHKGEHGKKMKGEGGYPNKKDDTPQKCVGPNPKQ